MSFRHVANVVGLLLVFVGAAMLVAWGVSLVYRDGDSLGIFLASLLTSGTGLLVFSTTRFGSDITAREGYAIVTLAWTGTAVFGALPYLFTGSLTDFVPAVFESMSGFTTTGATVFSDIESLPHGILFWRSFTHWLGGMGIIVLAIAVLPYLGVGGMQLFRAEVPGPTPERLRPRITQTAKLLWYVYVGMTVLQTVLYMMGGMDLFDAVNHTFATLATGGFSTRNASIAAFNSPYIQWITILFMYLAGVNFTLHFRAATGRPVYWKDEEWRFFTFVVVAAGVFVMGTNLYHGGYAMTMSGLEQAARDGFFQVVSITTTTGFVSADYEQWVAPSQVALFILMFVGGMAGSTGGGVKAVRIMLLAKYTDIQIRRHLHPRAIMLARMGRKPVREDVLANVIGFVVLYGILVVAGTGVMSLFDMDLMTALGVSAATVGNIGPGLGDVGPVDNYGWISDPALAILSFFMLVGRLEIYTVLILFHPDAWRNRGQADRRITTS